MTSQPSLDQLARVHDIAQVVPEGILAPAHVPSAVFSAAVDSYLAGQRLDMQALARRLRVARATLYRHAGNREQLMGEVLWWRSRHTLVDAVRRTSSLQGVPRVVAVISEVLIYAKREPSLRAFLANDPEAALRILTGAGSRVQQGMITTLERLVDLETARGQLRLGLDTPTLAFAIVRIAEGFLYADVIADRTPDVERAVTVIDALLRGLDADRQP
jgi:AcrR family transcriptional regulator